ncbi:hypothetical protein [Corynebacterium minutissimum]|nr:hypothetical protein [Corynebacterium minutissimum]QRP60156.1 hypothetical protein I6J26_08115 [Corynebacterium minutissimum]
MTHRRSTQFPLLRRKKIPMVAVAAAITSLGIFVSEQLPNPREVESAGFKYTDEIPGHSRLSDVSGSTRKLEPDEFAAFKADNASSVEELYEAKVDFTLQRIRNYPLIIKLEDSEGRVFRGKAAECEEEVRSLPTACTSSFIIPASALGPSTFRIEVEAVFGEGFHDQPLPMYKEIQASVELSA